MSYNYSKGSTVQGDIKAADDTQRDTLIDFGEDQIDFQTSGSVRMQVNNTGVEVQGGLDVTGDVVVEGNDLTIGEFTGQADLFLNSGTSGSRILLRGTGDPMSAGDNIGGVYFDATENDGDTIASAAWIISEPASSLYVPGSDMPTRLKFAVTKNNSSSPTDTLYIDGTSTVTRVGILDSTPSYTLDVNGDVRVQDDLFVDDFARIDALRVGTTSTDPGDGNLYVENDVTVANDLTVGGNVFDANNKSVVKLVDHGACLINESNTNERFLPDDIFHDYGGSNLYTTNAPPFSGSVDKLVVRGVNNSDLSLLGNLTAKVRIAGEGTDGYDVDTDNQCSNIESVTISSSDLGENKNCVFNFTGSNFTPQDIYAITLTPTNNWTSITNGAYINFTIVTSYIID